MKCDLLLQTFFFAVFFFIVISGAHILEYASNLLQGSIGTEDEFGRPHPEPSPTFERENIISYLEKCSESYITRSDPRRFLKQMQLFEKVSGTDGIAVDIEVRN